MLTPFIVTLLAGCTHVPRDGDFAEVERLVGERIPQKVHWYQGGEEDAQVKAALNELLKEIPFDFIDKSNQKRCSTGRRDLKIMIRN